MSKVLEDLQELNDHDFLQTRHVFVVKVYVQHGYFSYEVRSMEQAMAHGEAIMSKSVYRHVTPDGSVEFLKCYKVKVCGPGLRSEYEDEFHRT